MTRQTLPLRLDAAIRRKDAREACALAGQLPKPLALYRALEPTTLLGQVNDRRFETAARRFLARYVVERNPSFKEIAVVANAFSRLNHVGDLPGIHEGAVSSWTSWPSSSATASQTMPLVPVEQMLGRGIVNVLASMGQPRRRRLGRSCLLV